MQRKLVQAASWAILLGALYLLLAAKIEIWEFVAAIATGLIALVGVVAVTSASKPQFKIDIRWLAQLWRLPKRVVRDCVIVIAALGSRLVHPLKKGVFRATKSDAVGQTQSDARKRAFVITTSSVAPNTFVIGIDNEAKSISEHASGDSQRARGAITLPGWSRARSLSELCLR